MSTTITRRVFPATNPHQCGYSVTYYHNGRIVAQGRDVGSRYEEWTGTIALPHSYLAGLIQVESLSTVARTCGWLETSSRSCGSWLQEAPSSRGREW